MTLVQFRARFPEFNNLPDSVCQDAIKRGADQSDGAIFGNLLDESVGYLAAHFLALSPAGQQARLSAQDGSTTYMTHWRRIATMRAAGHARITL